MAVVSAIALGVAAVGTASSLKAGRDAAKEGRKANTAQRKINKLRNEQSKRSFLRNFRQQQANILSGSVASGADIESSATQGTLASQETQKGVALKEFKQFNKLGEAAGRARQAQADDQFRAGAFATVANFASNFISFGT